jgi:hypothetical protein
VLISVIKNILGRGPTLGDRLAEWSSAPYYDEATLAERMRVKSRGLLDAGYLRYPALVHIETQAVCNAACSFCPYPSLERKGTRMSDELIDKILTDLQGIPRDLPFQIAPYKVSDPFIEARLMKILQAINERLPHARISLISNGAALTERKIAELRAIRNVLHLSISLNYCDAAEYEKVMGIPFARTLQRLDALHEAKASGEFEPPVRLSRVSVNEETDLAYINWNKRRYPLFKSVIIPRNDWIGEVPNQIGAPDVPDAPCHRWFDLSITATGVVAMCCMDGEAKYPKGDVNRENALDIYNRPFLLELRSQVISRREAGDPCKRCTYASY